MIDFVNLKIKLTQSFRGVYRGRVYVHIFIGMSDHTCINICICPVFLKKGTNCLPTEFETCTNLNQQNLSFRRDSV
jgi:hypothetical protein